MVGGSDDFDLVTAMDVWIPPLVDKYLAPIDKDLAARKIDLKRYPDAVPGIGNLPDRNLRPSGPLPHPASVVSQGSVREGRAAAAQDLGRDGRGRQEDPGAEPRHRRRHHPLRQGRTARTSWSGTTSSGARAAISSTPSMKPIFNSPAGVKATQDFTDIILKHKITPAGAASFNEADSTTYFFQGKAAMVPVWWHVYNRLKLPGLPASRPSRSASCPCRPTRARARRPTRTTGSTASTASPRTATPRWSSSTTSRQPEIERSILLDPNENDVVCVHWSNLRDPEVNARFNGMHAIAAKALETTTKAIPNIPEFLPDRRRRSPPRCPTSSRAAARTSRKRSTAQPRRRPASCGAAAERRVSCAQ